MPLLGNNMQVDVWRFRHELLNREIVQVAAQPVHSRPPHNRLRYSILSYKRRSHVSGVPAREWNDIRSEISSKLQARLQGTLSLRQLVATAQNVQNVQFRPQGLCKPGSSRNKIPCLRTC